MTSLTEPTRSLVRLQQGNGNELTSANQPFRLAEPTVLTVLSRLPSLSDSVPACPTP